MRMGWALKLVLGIIGIYLSSICIAHYTQKIYTHPYIYYKVNNKGNYKQTKFTYSLLIAWSSCLTCYLWSLIFGKIMGQKQNSIKLESRRKLGFLFALNIIPGIFGLLYIHSSILTVAQTIRYMFLVFFGAFISKNQKNIKIAISKSKISVAFIIVLLAFFFLYQDFTQINSNENKQDSHSNTQKNIWIGVIILLITLSSDAFFVDCQVYCRNYYSPTPNHIFQSSNFYAFLIIFTVSFVTGNLYQQLKYLYQYPGVRWDLGVICIIQLLSQQIALYLIVINFNQSIYPLISSTRRIVILIISSIIFGQNVNSVKIICGIGILFSISWELLMEVKSKDNQTYNENNQKQKQ